MKNWRRKAFTLIELLIVIAILAILAVAVIVASNPVEAQRKARDTQRIKDATTLQAAIEQAIDAGLATTNTADTLGDTTAAGGTGVESSTAAAPVAPNLNIKTRPCDTNWLGIDVCLFVKTVPLDPVNGNTRSAATGASATAVAQTLMRYRATVVGSDYEIQVQQESATNWTKLTGDGGDDIAFFEIFGGLNTLF